MESERTIRYTHVALFLVVGLVLAFGYALVAPPSAFPSGSAVEIPEGASVDAIAQKLGDADIVAHPRALALIWRVTGTGERIQAGAYRFAKPENVFTVANRLVVGDYDIPPVRVTFPEGITVREMADIVAEKFALVSAAEFLAEARPLEGYLFPDTYLFAPASDATLIVSTLRATFDEKIKTLDADITASGRTLSDIVIMASLLEKEVRTTENRRIVSGVLWNRLARSMPLQVDAVFGYIFNRSTYSPTYDDLTVDSPYNTYRNTGLPPGPINNPGMDALSAALNPIRTDYLFYLTDKDGRIHYAKTYAEHQANERAFLH